MKKKVINSIMVLILLVGVGFLLFPIAKGYLFNKKSGRAIALFEQRSTQDNNSKLTQLCEDMKQYNRKVFTAGQTDLKDPFFFESPSFDLSKYGIDDGVIGSISIPKMDIEMPIYLGATEANMLLGAVNLGETSTPIGGENTNCVIAAHRGYSGAAMFADIELLEVGDPIYVTNFWETLAYEVVYYQVISPTDVEQVHVKQGEDMLTLLTCHPYAQNYDRYIVSCKRIPYEGIQPGKTKSMNITDIFTINEMSPSQKQIFIERYLPVSVLVLLSVLLVVIVLVRRKKRSRRKTNAE